MRAILVCVDFADLLSLTLPYNRHHFSEVMVVTAKHDHETIGLADVHGARVCISDAFYRDGAEFNKWLALEEALSVYGRHGVICNMDVDVCWPKKIPDPRHAYFKGWPVHGYLYTPKRRMLEEIPAEIPAEHTWQTYPLHPQQAEWAGYTQIFHGDDPVLPGPPWHQTNWRHAGGADSFFQARWPNRKKLRPPFEVLHLGPTGVNWAGRVAPYADGRLPDRAEQRRHALCDMLRQRGKSAGDPYVAEKFMSA